MPAPLLTICIVTRNCLYDLKQTLASLPTLSVFVNVVAVDGASTDGTYELLMSHSSANFTIYRESGDGIYFAMNIALRNANGRYIYFLNAGDQLLSQHIPLDYLLCSNLNEIIVMNTLIDSERYSGFDIPKSKFYFIKNTLCHQAVFVPRALYLSMNGFNTKYKCRADFDFFLCSYPYASYTVIPRTIAYINSVGFSSRNVSLYLDETRDILAFRLGYPTYLAIHVYRFFAKLIRLCLPK